MLGWLKRMFATKQVPVLHKRTVYDPAATYLWGLSPRFLGMVEDFDHPFTQNPVVYAAVSRISSNISAVPLLIKQGDRKDSNIVESGPYYDLFDRVNEHMDLALFMEAVCVHLTEPDGEVVVVLNGKKGRLGPKEVPYDMTPLSGHLFKPVMENKKLAYWEYYVPGETTKLKLGIHEVVRIRCYNPRNAFRGMGAGRPSEVTARTDWKMSRHNEAVMDNGGTLGGVFEAPPEVEISDDEVKQTIEKFMDKHQGPDKAGRFAYLERGVKINWNPNTLQAMQFKDGRELNRKDIAMAFGVPEEELMGTANVNMITGTGKLSGNRNFWTNRLLPMMSKIESAFNRQLMRRLDPSYFIEFDYDSIPALQPDLVGLLDVGLKMIDLGYTQNQINERLKLDMEKTEVGDIVWVRPGYMPLDSMTVEDDYPFDEEEPPEDEGDGGTPPVDGTEPDSNPPEGEAPEGGPPPDEQAQKRGKLRAILKEEMADPIKAELNNHWSRVAGLNFVPFEPRVRKRFTRYLMSQRAEQLRLIQQMPEPARAMSEPGFVESFLFDPEKWDRILVKSHTPLFEAAATAAIEKTENEITEAHVEPMPDRNKMRGRRPKLAKEVAADRMSRFKRVNQTIRREVANQVRIGVNKSETVQEIATRLRKYYSNKSRKYSVMVAKNEVSSIVSEARHRTMQVNDVQWIQWISARDEKVRYTHQQQHGEIIRLGQRFAFTHLRYPKDPNGALREVINCRCIARPVPASPEKPTP